MALFASCVIRYIFSCPVAAINKRLWQRIIISGIGFGSGLNKVLTIVSQLGHRLPNIIQRLMAALLFQSG